MKSCICIFEDYLINQLAPVNYLRHTSDLICGALSLRNKLIGCDGSRNLNITLHARKYLQLLLKESNPYLNVNHLGNNKYIFLNSRMIIKGNGLNKIIKFFSDKPEAYIMSDNPETIIAFHSDRNTGRIADLINKADLISHNDIKQLGLTGYHASELKLRYTEIKYPSDLVHNNETELHSDLDYIINGKKKIVTKSKNKISRYTEFDTSEGKIYIGKNTVIEPFVFIKGPVYIGDNCLIRSGSGIYGPVSIGNTSKISGEISSSVIHPFVNKQHFGFLGHSYICEWVNLGAGTTTSNLKNNYSQISLNIGGTHIETNSIFLGSIIGDHTKTGIGTMLNTGTVIGISSNLYGAGYHNKIIRSFTWNDAGQNKSSDYILEKAIETARISMKRRKTELSQAYEAVLNELYSNKENLPV